MVAQPVEASEGAGQATCTFQGGFKLLRDLIPEQVGSCVEDEHVDPLSGSVEQRTTGGLLVWRPADNWTAFTDGQTTWINGPLGVVSRPNSGPLFAWEASESGISGQILVGPACPVVRSDTPCPDHPYQGTIAVSGAQGQLVATFQTDPDGRFRVALPPGDYRLRPQGAGRILDAQQRAVTVVAGQFSEIVISLDSGIR